MSRIDEKRDPKALAFAEELGIPPVLDEKYRLLRLIGEGGFAWVFEAQHVIVTTMHVAIKVLRPEHLENENFARRFFKEAVTCAAIRSPYAVTILDHGMSAAGLPWIAMEFVEGPPLSSLIRDSKGLPINDVYRISIQVLSAIVEAHEIGVMHRDLKPENVFMTRFASERHPVAKVGDFGIARIIVDDSPLAAHMSQTAGLNILCTPEYAAPELLLGSPETRSDIYALGIMMCEMIDGIPPVVGNTPMATAAMQAGPHSVPLSERVRSSSMCKIIERAVAKDLCRRYPNARLMLRDLRNFYARVCPHPGRDTPLHLDVEEEAATVAMRSEEIKRARELAAKARRVREEIDEWEREESKAQAEPRYDEAPQAGFPAGTEVSGGTNAADTVARRQMSSVVNPTISIGRSRVKHRTLLAIIILWALGLGALIAALLLARS